MQRRGNLVTRPWIGSSVVQRAWELKSPTSSASTREHDMTTVFMPCISVEVWSHLGSVVFPVAELVGSRPSLYFNFHVLGQLSS